MLQELSCSKDRTQHFSTRITGQAGSHFIPNLDFLLYGISRKVRMRPFKDDLDRLSSRVVGGLLTLPISSGVLARCYYVAANGTYEGKQPASVWKHLADRASGFQAIA